MVRQSSAKASTAVRTRFRPQQNQTESRTLVRDFFMPQKIHQACLNEFYCEHKNFCEAKAV